MSMEDEAFRRDMLEIKSQLQEVHEDLKRFMERSNTDHMDLMLSEFKRSFSEVLFHHLSEDIDEGLRDNMVKECHMIDACKALFSQLLKDNASLILDDDVSDETVNKFRSKLDEMKTTKAPYERCDKCFQEASKLLDKQINLMRSMRIYKGTIEIKQEIQEIQEIPIGLVLKDLLEPLTNKQRLQILKSLATETRTFTTLSELTGLRGGNLLFHLQKLLEGGMILQRHERGDYMITVKGYGALKGICNVYYDVNR